jgi:hypothetical protein
MYPFFFFFVVNDEIFNKKEWAGRKGCMEWGGFFLEGGIVQTPSAQL